MPDLRIRELPVQATLPVTATFAIDDPSFSTARRITGALLDSRYLLAGNNLSDVDNIATARTSLGLGITDTPEFEKLGINTTTVPHGAVGGGRLAIEGANGSVADGPHAQWTTGSDDYPLLQVLAWSHDNVSLLFDMYYDGAWRSSDAGSNFIYQKSGDALAIRSYSGVAVGSAVPSWYYNQRWESNGDCTMGISSSGSAQLYIEQPSTTDAQPVLYLYQKDIDEPMIQLATTIGVGNAIEAVGAKTLTPTHFIMCEIPGGLTRYWEVGTIA